MKVKIRGKYYQITKKKVEEKLKGIEADNVRIYYVELHGKKIPIKQVLSEALNIPKAGFTTQDAYHILQRLGFEVMQSNGSR